MTSQQSNQYRYDLICEAYDVLSNEKRKAIFDIYGEFGLKNGITDQNGKKTETYVYLGNSDEISSAFFGTTHFNANSFEYNGSDLFGSLLGDGHKALNQPQKLYPKDVEVTVQCSLAEFYNGSAKKISYKRTATTVDGRTLKIVEEEHLVLVKPGHSNSTVLIFKGKGNQQYDHYQRSNLIVKLQSLPEPDSRFSRSGNNLIYTHSISLRDSLDSSPIQILTLDGR